jgi:hypothetical protein
VIGKQILASKEASYKWLPRFQLDRGSEFNRANSLMNSQHPYM